MWSRDKIDSVKHKLREWEDPINPLAPLTQTQLQSLHQLETELNQQNLEANNIPSKEETGGDKPENVFELLDMCNSLECEVMGETNRAHESLVLQLQEWLTETDSVLAAVDNSLAALDKLKEQHTSVSESTSLLHASCRALAAQESQLAHLNEQMTDRLEPLIQLPGLTDRLSNPTLSLAGGSFYLALNRLDHSLQYIDAHPEYKEAGHFRASAHFALTRAVSAMQEACRSSFELAAQQVLSLPQQTDLSGGAGLALSVGRFQASASRARQILKQVETRLHVAPEYERLLANCREMYIEQRASLLAGSVATAMQELVARHKGDHCALLRAACTFCYHVCKDEYHLYLHFFSSESEELWAYLDRLCGCLYDILRPVIIHVNHLETLAELCTILRFEWVEEQLGNNPEGGDSVRRTLVQLLQDLQERLVFRAHVHIQTDVLNYSPGPGDLAYPEKLLMMENIAASVTTTVAVSSRASVAESDVSRVHGSPADIHGMWYPPVRRVLATLSRLYRCVDRGIFQGLSQEALTSCVTSVTRAANLIAQRSSEIDGILFEMKHLLILREQVTPFHVDFSVQETSLDFTRVKSAVFNLFQNRNHLFSLSNNSLLEFLLEGTPTVKHMTLDSRKEVDNQLKSVCDKFIQHCVHILTPLISPLPAKISAHNAETSGVLKQQPWCTPQEISSAVADSQRQIKTQLPIILKSIQLYLACTDTELLLYRHIKMRVLAVYQVVETALASVGFSEEQMTVIALPTHQQIQLLLTTAAASQNPQPS